jgi:hypothetical protein
MSETWTKHDEWKPAWNSGPSYRHQSGRVFVSGGYGTIGDNLRGWRKTRFYRVFVVNGDGTVSQLPSTFQAVARAKAYAERFLNG